MVLSGVARWGGWLGRKQAVALGLVLAAMLVGVGIGSGRVEAPVTTSGSSPVPESRPGSPETGYAVHVSGRVARPGVVFLHEGAIVADAVAAAGGALDGALLESVNLAAPVLAGEHIHVPGPGEGSGAVSAGGTGGDDGPISLSRADSASLEKLPGIGPVIAERIIAHREANGPFEAVDDLLEVPGIGEAKLASIRDLVVP